MIDSLLNLVFRCPHRHLTRPLAPVTKTGQPHSQSYVVCLDCGKQFEYDLNEMRVGKAIAHSHDHCVVPPKTPRKAKVGFALLAAVPALVVMGAVLKRNKKESARLGSPQSGSIARDKPGAAEPEDKS